jgi:hypothetical protein
MPPSNPKPAAELQLSFATGSRPNASELLDLCKAVNEMTMACGTALNARAISLEQRGSTESVDFVQLDKTTRKLTASAMILAENTATLISHLAAIIGTHAEPRR